MHVPWRHALNEAFTRFAGVRNVVRGSGAERGRGSGGSKDNCANSGLLKGTGAKEWLSSRCGAGEGEATRPWPGKEGKAAATTIEVETFRGSAMVSAAPQSWSLYCFLDRVVRGSPQAICLTQQRPMDSPRAECPHSSWGGGGSSITHVSRA